MSEPLATKYRPATFGDVAGQKPPVALLYLMARKRTVPPGLLLYGEHGSGKTTMGRIVGRALNCEAEPGPARSWPCGRCPSCLAVASGASPDVEEIDAASNGTVEMARALRERALYGPSAGRCRVFIIDEAHSMSAQAFEVFLKIFEEPPPSTVFILVTTQPDAVPKTIRSRLSQFRFRPLPTAVILARLQEVCAAEGFGTEPGLLAAIAEMARGAMRDALVMLDQVTSAGIDSLDMWRQLTGEGDFAPVVLTAAADGDYPAMYAALDDAMAALGDPAHVARELAGCLRDLLVLGCGGEIARQGAALESRRELAARVGVARAHAALGELWALTSKVRPEDREAGLSLAAAMIARRLCPEALEARAPIAAGEIASLAEIRSIVR
jgi:DNA polymerase III subunit gamma/tau